MAGYVALSSVATCIGCILGGHLGEAALDPSIGIPRPFCLAPMFLLMVVGSLGIALGPAGLLYGNVFVTMFGAKRSVTPGSVPPSQDSPCSEVIPDLLTTGMQATGQTCVSCQQRCTSATGISTSGRSGEFPPSFEMSCPRTEQSSAAF